MILDDVGIVVIGRNEGTRLVQCLSALSKIGSPVVYVDSGSSDGSVEAAQQMNIDVIALDNHSSYTAARGRNAGFEYLFEKFPRLRFVQFLDGDCIIVQNWLEIASFELRTREELVMVCGRLRERCPKHSVYNRLCDMEWNTHAGEARSCGGNCMVRVTSFGSVGGFDPALVAGEEPELCWRLRRAGGKIERLSADMATHDAALISFVQWWKRQIRAGHAVAENADRHGRNDRQFYVRDLASNIFYGIVIPSAAVLISLISFLASLAMILVLYSRLFFRVRSGRRLHGDLPSHANLYAVFTVIGKFPQTVGVLCYIWRRKLLVKESQLVEYK